VKTQNGKMFICSCEIWAGHRWKRWTSHWCDFSFTSHKCKWLESKQFKFLARTSCYKNEQQQTLVLRVWAWSESQQNPRVRVTRTRVRVLKKWIQVL